MRAEPLYWRDPQADKPGCLQPSTRAAGRGRPAVAGKDACATDSFRLGDRHHLTVKFSQLFVRAHVERLGPYIGEAAFAHVVKVYGDGGAHLVADVRVAADELRLVTFVEAEGIVEHQHPAIAGGARPRFPRWGFQFPP